ncbi:hypothetical protein GOBAR_DD20260 [Gossypium barbadense]|nr:hypothetical protein GOBAR_DD20260 [Gossypium barbadense]
MTFLASLLITKLLGHIYYFDALSEKPGTLPSRIASLLITKLLGHIYYFDALSEKPGTLPSRIATAVNGVAFCETLAGQLFFGWLGDKLGQKRVYGLILMLMVICSFASGFSFGKSPDGVMATLCFFRFWLVFTCCSNCSSSYYINLSTTT